MNLPTDAAARRASDKIGRLLQEVEALIAHDERMHRGSLLRVATEVLGIDAADADRVARKNNNSVAEILFAQFDVEMQRLLRPNRPVEDVYTAIFIYGVLSEDVVANSDVVILRATGQHHYAHH